MKVRIFVAGHIEAGSNRVYEAKDRNRNVSLVRAIENMLIEILQAFLHYILSQNFG